jgi:hypothetical protein
MEKKEDVVENFCGACLAVPLAIAGAGTAGVAAKGSHGKTKKILLGVGITVVIISLIIGIVYLTKCKKCR